MSDYQRTLIQELYQAGWRPFQIAQMAGLGLDEVKRFLASL